ncbi:hypothetical protein S7711_01646 [Stachybotrys chartarum IBT 7711]|uniref:Uncharacterized protein n=1 Tax=Stachybotrys chartarum (strain CBS 109288 / IBT 7711) TaxID=1280523 RepID=A0A084AV58_STACB|nr:hypothetical protein S7711_01646 [Stachybotrys chartarum IBT 7711]KFA53779.1 hypothetical protein S40293_01674 [Stachybotrys chartarum IBT 40293]
MGSAREARHAAQSEHAEAPPSYDAAHPAQSSPGAADPSVATTPNSSSGAGPTVESPFNFPSDAPLPSYLETTASSSSAAPTANLTKPIAIPQGTPTPMAPFIDAYAPTLLAHGITPESWQSFLTTITAFLTAKVSKRALSYTTDVLKEMSGGGQRVYKEWVSHAKLVGTSMGKNAKKGNVVGLAANGVAGLISLPAHAALGLVVTAAALPGEAIAALFKAPSSPRRRVEAYLTVANKDWLLARGLKASVMDSNQLSELVGVPVVEIAKTGRMNAKGDITKVEAQFAALDDHISALEIRGKETALEVEATTLWLVVSPIPVESLQEPVTST